MTHSHYCRHCDTTWSDSCLETGYDASKRHDCWQRKQYVKQLVKALEDDTKETPFPHPNPLSSSLKHRHPKIVMLLKKYGNLKRELTASELDEIENVHREIREAHQLVIEHEHIDTLKQRTKNDIERVSKRPDSKIHEYVIQLRNEHKVAYLMLDQWKKDWR